MAMESWSANEYRTFATSRRDDVFENREASAFTFMRPAVGEVGCSGGYSEKEVYFDADVKTVQWESVVRMALRNSPNAEFEFEFKSAPVSPVVSHPDEGDVFLGAAQVPVVDYSYGSSTQRGEHPVYRKQVELDDGSMMRTPTFVVSQRTVPEPFSQMSPHSLSRMYQPKYSKFCVNATDVAPVETAMDSRSSSFRSQTSMCEAGDRSDTGGSTSTSRDSNGSSNDASSVSTDTTFDRAFDVFDHRSISATTPKPKPPPPPHHQRASTPCTPTDRCTSSVSTTTSDHCDKAPLNASSSWLRSPLKWKGIFGAKKASKPPRDPQLDRSSTRPTSKLAEMSRPARPMSRLFHPVSCDDKIHHLPSKPRSFLALPHGPKPGEPSSSSKGSSSSLNKLSKPAFASSDSSDIHSVVSSDRDHSGLVKIRERWLKYMRMLKPPYGKASSSKPEINGGAVERGGSFPDHGSAIGHHHDAGYVHTRAKSMPAILKTPPLRPRSNPGNTIPTNSSPSSARSSMIPPAGPSSARKNSFLAHSGSLVGSSNSSNSNSSSSPRLMKNSSPRLMSLSPKVMKSSSSSPKVSVTTISPRMSSSSASSMSELHSAVQGAIAHCKQSHSGLLSPDPGPSSELHHH